MFRRSFDHIWTFCDLCEIHSHWCMTMTFSWPLGLEGDPDLQFLLKGADLLKVKSKSWRKTRYFRLNEDCKTVWQPTSKSFKSDSSCKCLCCLFIQCLCCLFIQCLFERDEEKRIWSWRIRFTWNNRVWCNKQNTVNLWIQLSCQNNLFCIVKFDQ